MPAITPGLVVLLGSGEALPSSGKIHEFVARRLPEKPKLVILETPAGFEPNSDLVAGKIKDFLSRRLQNYQPVIEVVPARKRGTSFSPDDPQIVSPILEADEIFLGPGSPTYGVRQLKDSLAFQMLNARHLLGGALFLSSSAPLSFGLYTLPVYEIYKAGLDLHWMDGLDFFGGYGLPLSFVTHWNNKDGGDELDTSCCYIGQARFDQLHSMLPREHTIVGIDEHTALILDFVDGICYVQGTDTITILRAGEIQVIQSGEQFSMDVLGKWQIPQDHHAIPDNVWNAALQAKAERETTAQRKQKPSEQVISLLNARDQARANQDWAAADELREQLAILGWGVNDTPGGSQLVPLEDN